MRRFLRGSAVTVSVVFLVLLHTLLTGRFWFWNIFAVIPSLAFSLVFLVAAAWTAWRRTSAGAVLCVLLAPLIWWNSDIVTSPWMSSDTGNGDIRVFSWNTEFWEAERKPEMFALLQEQKADLYLLQERMTIRGIAIRDTGDVRRAFPGYHLAEQGEFLTLSRYPILQSVLLSHQLLRTDLQMEGTVISVYNVHLASPYDLDLLPHPLAFLRDMRRRFNERAVDFDILERDVGQNTHDVLIAGDFNTTKAMGKMRPILNKTQDAFHTGDVFFPRTWEFGTLRLWRIDYILSSAGLHPLSHKTLWLPGYSDHAAQEAVFGR